MSLLQIIAVILLVLWLSGFGLHVAGDIIHILLLLALLAFVISFLKRR